MQTIEKNYKTDKCQFSHFLLTFIQSYTLELILFTLWVLTILTVFLWNLNNILFSDKD